MVDSNGARGCNGEESRQRRRNDDGGVKGTYSSRQGYCSAGTLAVRSGKRVFKSHGFLISFLFAVRAPLLNKISCGGEYVCV